MRAQRTHLQGSTFAVIVIIGALACLLGVNPARAQTAAPAISVQQASFSTGIQPIESAGSAADFYHYDNYHANTGLEQANHSLLFFHYDSTSGQLALIVIQSGRPEGDLGGSRFTFTGLPPSSTLAVRDDPNDSYNFAPPQADFLWYWDPGYSDGAVIDSLGGQFAITIQPIFKKGITEWDLLSAEPDGSVRTIPLPSMTQPVTLSLGAAGLGPIGPVSGGQGPIASFTLSFSPVPTLVPVVFDASSSQAFGGSRIVRYQWDFTGNGIFEESTNQARITHVFQKPGTMRVTLQVTDSSGRQARASQTLQIIPVQTTATRTLSTPQAIPNATFRVTLELNILTPSSGLGVEEDWPTGWTIIAVKNDGAAFKELTRQWIFPSFLPAGTTKEIIYDVQVPPVEQLQARSLPSLVSVTGSVSSATPRYRLPITGESQVEIDSCLSVPVAAAHLDLTTGDVNLRLDKVVSAEQTRRVIQLWQNSGQLPYTCAGALSLDQLVEVVRRQLQVIPVDQPLSPITQSGSASPVSVTRTILTPLPFHQLYRLADGGRTFKVELDIQADQDIYGLGIRERIPDGWQLQPVANPGAAFNPSTVEWLFSDVINAGQFRTIIYQVTAPADQPVGSSLFQGMVILAPQGSILIAVQGDDQVELVACLSIPVAISHLNTKTHTIDLSLGNVIQRDQMMAAINFWFDDAVVPGTCGLQLDLPTLQHLIDLAVAGTPIDKQ